MAKSNSFGGVSIGIPPAIKVSGVASKHSTSIEVASVDPKSLSVGQFFVSDVTTTTVEIDVSAVDVDLLLVTNIASLEISETSDFLIPILAGSETLDTQSSGLITFAYSLTLDKKVYLRPVITIEGTRIFGKTIEVFLKSLDLATPATPINPNAPAKPVGEVEGLIENSWPDTPLIGFRGGSDLGWVPGDSTSSVLGDGPIPVGEMLLLVTYPSVSKSIAKKSFVDPTIEVQFATDAGFTNVVYTEANKKNYNGGPADPHTPTPINQALPFYEYLIFGDGYTSTDIPIGEYYVRARVTGGIVGATPKTTAWSEAKTLSVVNLGITYSSSIFLEKSINDGTMDNSIEIDIIGTTFSAGVVSSGYVTATNVPTGLTASFVRTSDTKITFSLTGTATTHGVVNSISNLTVQFADEAFVGYTAAQVPNSLKTDLQVSYRNSAVQVLYSGGSFTEAMENDGSFVSILSMDLSGSTFTSDVVSNNLVSATNVPNGLVASFTRVSDSRVSMALLGNATSHDPANDISNLTVQFADGSFVGYTAAQVQNSLRSNIQVLFTNIPPPSFTLAMSDPSIVGTAFEENLHWDGYMLEGEGCMTEAMGMYPEGAYLNITLNPGNTFTSDAHQHANVDPLLPSYIPDYSYTFTRINPNLMTLRVNGLSMASTPADSISDLGIELYPSAFEGGIMDTIRIDNIPIRFFDDVLTSNNSLQETVADTGLIGGLLSFYRTSAGLPDTTFFNSDVVSANKVAVYDVPAGLTPVWTYVDGSEVQLSFTGTATDHTGRDHYVRVEFQQSAFQSTNVYKGANAKHLLRFIGGAPSASELEFDSYFDGILNTSSTTGVSATLALGKPDDEKLTWILCTDMGDIAGTTLASGVDVQTFTQDLGVWYGTWTVPSGVLTEGLSAFLIVRGIFGGIPKELVKTVYGNSLASWPLPVELDSGFDGSNWCYSMQDDFVSAMVGGFPVYMKVEQSGSLNGEYTQAPITTQSDWLMGYNGVLEFYQQFVFNPVNMTSGINYFRAQYWTVTGKTAWVQLTTYNNV